MAGGVHVHALGNGSLELGGALDEELFGATADSAEKDEAELALGDLVVDIGDLGIFIDKATTKLRDGEVVVAHGGKDGELPDVSLEILELELGDGLITLTNEHLPREEAKKTSASDRHGWHTNQREQ